MRGLVRPQEWLCPGISYGMGAARAGLGRGGQSRALAGGPPGAAAAEEPERRLPGRERITLDGELWSDVAQRARGEAARSRRPGLAAAAPSAAPVSEVALGQLTAFLESSRRLVVLTGAGVSTESNLPDYRSPQGAYSTGFKPMTHQQFMKSDASRRRYWARSFFGWPEFAQCQPNASHEALAQLEALGRVHHVVTQNVDRLHQAAGSRNVLELHGTTHEVVCLGCGDVSPRWHLQERLAELNPEAAEAARLGARGLPKDGEPLRPWEEQAGGQTSVRAGTAADGNAVRGDAEALPSVLVAQPSLRRPDGDTELAQRLVEAFRVPSCTRCGGVLKPHVVFFGDNLPPGRRATADALVAQGDALLVVGSSLAVFSAFRLARAVHQAGKPLAILTAGATRADGLGGVLKVEALAGETLPRLLRSGGIMVPATWGGP
mmetsp:Transcript_16567/g.46768  ORF Transcript_16567/g.46768 Transcript_16567/m.46768 type:complete len:434 (-) Transcript_16567:147-1448(-)